MSRKIRVRVFGRFDGRANEATVTIDRSAGLISVRPLRRRREYTLPLAAVAQMIAFKVVSAELAERRRGRRLAKRGIR